jgi:ankyrin repeat protein
MVDVADSNGLAPLHAAALATDPAMVELVVSAGARLDAQDREGVTPLIQAARSGDREVILKLIERGASTSLRMRTGFGDDALSAASRGGHIEAVRALLAGGAEINASEGNPSALAAAASQGEESIVALLLERGATVRAGALCAAASGGSAAIVGRLLAAGADPNERIDIHEPHDLSFTPLANAVVAVAPEIAALLVAAGADVNARDARGDSVLILLAETTNKASEQVEVARILLAAGAEVNARGDGHRTPVEVAKQNGNALLVDALLAAGADPTLAPSG